MRDLMRVNQAGAIVGFEGGIRHISTSGLFTDRMRREALAALADALKPLTESWAPELYLAFRQRYPDGAVFLYEPPWPGRIE